MSSLREKLVAAVLALLFLVAAAVLLTVGSFLPLWAQARNVSVQGNVSFSLWRRQECFGLVCTTRYKTVQWSYEECDTDVDPPRCVLTTGTKLKKSTKCRVADYCNSTWVVDADMDSKPSMLVVATAFETPAIFFGIVCIVLFIIKIVLLIKWPSHKRLHLKAAYLTFGAIAGVVSIVGVILFCTMLEGDKYERRWAPFVNLAGGIAFCLFGFGGYLRWRDHTADGDFDDDNSLYEQNLNEIRPHGPVTHRQTSQTSSKAAEARV